VLLHVEVQGRVQGVGFRWFVREEARRLGLAGWVRNLESGAVEVVAGGRAEAIASLRRALGEGPPAAEVAQVVDLPVPEGELPAPFTVMR
jgi:acylphosphatase